MSNVKKRGNGQGTVYKRGNTWQCEVRTMTNGNITRATKGGFKTKTEALKYIEILKFDQIKKPDKTFIEVFDSFIDTHEKSHSTINCYKAAIQYFSEIHDMTFRNITIDDLQECINDCPKGKRTQENMRAVVSLLYKYAIPRNFTDSNLNLATYLKIYTKADTACKYAFPIELLPDVKKRIGSVSFAEHIYCMCYTGFRAQAFLNLKISDYDPEHHCLIGGSKTEAGINRVVTLSPNVEPVIRNIIGDRTEGYIFRHVPYERFRFYFYEALDRMNISNPVVDGHRMYTPHSCRRTFATMLKNISGSDKDKLELMGHTSTEMLRLYQSVNYQDLLNITNQI